ncbi:hypothetical protein OROGR_027331 [Orobanche gracilis]
MGVGRGMLLIVEMMITAGTFFYGCSMGLDLIKGTVRNNLEAGVIEPAMSKVKIIQYVVGS